jgi:hypothetical protein
VKHCGICGQECETGAGLASHRRAKHPRIRGANRIAIEELLASTVCEVDPATQQMARSLADTLDGDPSNAQMWRTYRETIQAIVGNGDAGDETNGEVEAIRGAAKVGHLKAI